MKTRSFKKPFIEVFEATLQAIKECDFSIESKNKERGKIIASTGFSLRSWGETINIEIAKGKNKTRVSIFSDPKAQLLDWGKSEENEENIIKALTRRLG
jgi:hypothetical protein